MFNTLDNDYQRRRVLLTLIIITTVAAFFLALVNFFHGHYPLAGAQFGFGAYSLILAALARRYRPLAHITLAYLIPFFSLVLLSVATPGIQASVVVWIVIIPVVSLFLLGRRTGLILALVFLFATLTMAALRFTVFHPFGEWGGMINVLLCTLIVLMLAYVHERERERAELRLREQAITDSLTGIPNRVALPAVFDTMLARAHRQQGVVSVMMLDVDHFKHINDQLGHEGGDEVLQWLAEQLRQRLRGNDFVCRMGGEEFCILLPETSASEAAIVAEALRNQLSGGMPLTSTNNLPFSVSIGVATLGTDGEELKSLLRAADVRLYRAKARGRNRVEST